MQQIYSRAPLPKCDFNSCFATLLKSHFSMGFLLFSPVICCIFSEHRFLKTPLGGCFCKNISLRNNLFISLIELRNTSVILKQINYPTQSRISLQQQMTTAKISLHCILKHSFAKSILNIEQVSIKSMGVCRRHQSVFSVQFPFGRAPIKLQ